MSRTLFRVGDLWSRRSLVLSFAINDLKLRYRNSVLGFLWSILEPLLMLSVLYIVFSTVIKSDIQNYPLYLLLGIIMWNMLNRGTSMSLSSVINRGGLITKIYFPREIPAISSCITSFIMMVFEFTVLAAFFIAFQFIPSPAILLLPLLLLIEFVFVLGLSLPLSVLNVYYRDMQYIWAVILHGGFFLMPIIYSLKMLPETLQSYIWLIPMARILDMAHNLALYDLYPSINDWIYITATSVATMLLGIVAFRRLEGRIGEEL